jgi:hypothetical protein
MDPIGGALLNGLSAKADALALKLNSLLGMVGGAAKAAPFQS